MQSFIILIVLIIMVPTVVGALATILFGRKARKTRGPVGLLLHSISDHFSMHCSYYSPGKFESLVSRLRGEGYHFRTVSESASENAASAGRIVVMTFDDGFESFYAHALPILERHSAKSTVFPVAGFLGKSSSWDALPQQKHLTSGQVREISDLGHEIGSHTLTHASLALLNDRDIEAELLDSKKILEDIIGRPVTSLSFPFGRFDDRVWKIARRIGFTSATSYKIGRKTFEGIVRLSGAYSYDSVQDVMDRAVRSHFLSQSLARGRLMPHFAKGSPMWKFRNTYSVKR
jgi:peptidoglycan/xylan/chitin deacetylase (PgdA/CDA1 family)